MSDLGDFFSLIGEQKKKKEEEKKEIIGKTSLTDLFAELAEEKKKVQEQKRIEEEKIQSQKRIEEEKKKELIGEITLDSLFTSLSKQKKQEKEKLEKLQKDVKAFEALIFSEPKKKKKKDDYEELKKEIGSKEKPVKPAIEEEKVEEIVEELVEEVVVEKPKEIDNTVELLAKMIPEEEIIKEEENDMVTLKREVDQLRKMLYQTIRDVNVQGGGGEVRLEFMDDVDRDSVKVDGQVLAYQASTGKFIGTTGGSGGGGAVDLGPLTNIAAASTTSITQGSILSFDVSTGQFIATTVVSAGTTTLAGYPITGDNPQNNEVLTFNADASRWEFDSPFTIVDLSDGVQDGHQDYGAFE